MVSFCSFIAPSSEELWEFKLFVTCCGDDLYRACTFELSVYSHLLLTGRCYKTEICAILLPLRCSFRWHHFFAEVIFWPKTMDVDKAF